MSLSIESQLERAISLALVHHQLQTDKAGNPYILHPLWVMSNTKSIKGKIVAVMHDLIEDTDVTIEELKLCGFDEDIVEAIKILTKSKNQNYMDYIKIVGQNELAREVKMIDLLHNMDLSRLKKVTNKDKERKQKYQSAYQYLKAISENNK